MRRTIKVRRDRTGKFHDKYTVEIFWKSQNLRPTERIIRVCPLEATTTFTDVASRSQAIHA